MVSAGQRDLVVPKFRMQAETATITLTLISRHCAWGRPVGYQEEPQQPARTHGFQSVKETLFSRVSDLEPRHPASWSRSHCARVARAVVRIFPEVGAL